MRPVGESMWLVRAYVLRVPDKDERWSGDVGNSEVSKTR